jgi:hypothetical protein
MLVLGFHVFSRNRGVYLNSPVESFAGCLRRLAAAPREVFLALTEEVGKHILDSGTSRRDEGAALRSLGRQVVWEGRGSMRAQAFILFFVRTYRGISFKLLDLTLYKASQFSEQKIIKLP